MLPTIRMSGCWDHHYYTSGKSIVAPVFSVTYTSMYTQPMTPILCDDLHVFLRLLNNQVPGWRGGQCLISDSDITQL